MIFDIGGVLAYDVWEYLFQFDNSAIVEKYHIDIQKVKEAAEIVWEKYAHTKQDYEETWQALEQEFWDEFKKEIGITVPTVELIALSQEHFRPVLGMTILLEWLHEQHFDLLICSNNTEFFFQRQRKAAGFERYFEKRKIILSNHYGESKNGEKLAMFRAVERQMDFPKEAYLFVDDKEKNIAAALNYGILPLLFPREAAYGHAYVKEIITKMNNS